MCCDTARPKRELAVNVKTLGNALNLFALISCHFLFLDALHKICLVCIAVFIPWCASQNLSCLYCSFYSLMRFTKSVLFVLQFLFLDALHKICLVCIAEMVQEPIRKNAAHFMTLMPMFAQRLAQRDYDFILVPPNKKRLLLKMYTVGEQEKLRLVWDE